MPQAIVERCKIALIEDSAVSRNHVEKIASQHQWELASFNGPPEVEQLLKYDIVLSDYMFPRENATKMLSDLKAAGYDGGIILVTSMPVWVLKESNVLNHVNVLLNKPFTSEELLAAVRVAATKSQPHGSSQFWVAKRNRRTQKPELFESPHLILWESNSAVFESVLLYSPGDEIILWLKDPRENLSSRYYAGTIVSAQKKPKGRNHYRASIDSVSKINPDS